MEPPVSIVSCAAGFRGRLGETILDVLTVEHGPEQSHASLRLKSNSEEAIETCMRGIRFTERKERDPGKVERTRHLFSGSLDGQLKLRPIARGVETMDEGAKPPLLECERSYESLAVVGKILPEFASV